MLKYYVRRPDLARAPKRFVLDFDPEINVLSQLLNFFSIDEYNEAISKVNDVLLGKKDVEEVGNWYYSATVSFEKTVVSGYDEPDYVMSTEEFKESLEIWHKTYWEIWG